MSVMACVGTDSNFYSHPSTLVFIPVTEKQSPKERTENFSLVD
jgi:hypothetical protein